MPGKLFPEVSAEIFNQANKAHSINATTILLILIEKGIATPEEIDKARTQATHIVDQEFAKKEEAARNTHSGTAKSQ